MIENVYTDEQLLQYLKDFYIENNRVPTTDDFRKRKPNASTFFLRFGSWKNALKAAGLQKDKYKITGYTDKELIDFLVDYYNKFNKVPRTRDFDNNDYPDSETYRLRFGSWKNALIKAGLYDLREDKYQFGQTEYSADELLSLLNNYIIKNNKIPVQDEFTSKNNLPSISTYTRSFGSYENVLNLLGYEYSRVKLKFSTEELIYNLQKLYKELGRTPSMKDIDNCKWASGSSIYCIRFGNYYKALDAANIPYKITSRLLTNEEIIIYWHNLKDTLKRIPTIKDMKNSSINIYASIKMRWSSYTDFLISINEKVNYNKYGCKVYLTKNDTKCFSYYEFLITSWLENNNINFVKDYPYKNAIKNDNTERTFDWIVYHNDKTYYIECFGIIGNDKYNENMQNKILDCKNNNINLICIYPDDFKKSIDEIMIFLQ